MTERLHNTLKELYPDVRIAPIAGGHTQTERGLAVLPQHGRCFIKAGYDDRTRASIATEAAVLTDVESAHLPRLIHHQPGLLIIEDLSGAHWPPPWEGDPNAIWTALDRLSRCVPPPVATPIADDREPWDGFDRVGSLLGSALTRWLDRHLEQLIESALMVSPAGTDFIHADLSVENLCVAPRGVVIVDWEFASIGNPELDVATVSLDLVAGGIDPADIPLADATGWAAQLAIWLLDGSIEHSEWAADPEALRSERLSLAEAALGWWARNLGLSDPPRIRATPRSE